MEASSGLSFPANAQPSLSEKITFLFFEILSTMTPHLIAH
jgi:hypothetical protein